MRESLQREVEENIYKAQVLKEAMKESSDRDAEILISEEDQEYNKNEDSIPNNRSNTSLSRNQAQGQSSQQQSQQQSVVSQQNGKNAGNTVEKEKRSRLDRIFGRKASVNSQASSSLRNHQVTPHPTPQPTSQLQPHSRPSSQYQTPSPSLRPSNTLTTHANRSTGHSNSSATDLNNLKYLPVGEESEEEEVRDRSMGVSGAAVGGLSGEAVGTGTEVKLHPTRAKTFTLPKSLRNLKRRIAALRAKGTDLDAEKREREERERAANGKLALVDEKKKFTFIRLLPWKSVKKPATTTTTATHAVASPATATA
ncbi:hypothetical protein EDD11_004567 [Mortierella claussenii]|nr:hypothetical protein EDD11_004567 [Mortierella claussenii]